VSVTTPLVDPDPDPDPAPLRSPSLPMPTTWENRCKPQFTVTIEDDIKSSMARSQLRSILIGVIQRVARNLISEHSAS
jgi:hypothetical protein